MYLFTKKKKKHIGFKLGNFLCQEHKTSQIWSLFYIVQSLSHHTMHHFWFGFFFALYKPGWGHTSLLVTTAQSHPQGWVLLQSPLSSDERCLGSDTPSSSPILVHSRSFPQMVKNPGLSEPLPEQPREPSAMLLHPAQTFAVVILVAAQSCASSLFDFVRLLNCFVVFFFFLICLFALLLCLNSEHNPTLPERDGKAFCLCPQWDVWKENHN